MKKCEWVYAFLALIFIGMMAVIATYNATAKAEDMSVESTTAVFGWCDHSGGKEHKVTISKIRKTRPVGNDGAISFELTDGSTVYVRRTWDWCHVNAPLEEKPKDAK